MHSYQPKNGHGLKHDPFKSIVAPRPIGWISTVSTTGKNNLAPYSFFNGFNDKPPILGFGSQGDKDTLRNARDTGEFVWNLVSRHLSSAMAKTSGSQTIGADEFLLSGLTPVESIAVKAPRVLESLVSMECKLTQIVQMRSCDGTDIPTWVVFGEAIFVHIDEILIKDGLYDIAAAGPVMRGGRPGEYMQVNAQALFYEDWHAG
jgi:flavin reductase (DIM6/NTAB) family NADH-FMN oxidoreductase RutF